VDIAERLRVLVRETVPEADERAYTGWHAIGYRTPRPAASPASSLATSTATCCSSTGSGCPTSTGVLEGEGTQTRYIRIWDPDEIPHEAARRLLREAVA